MLQWTTLGIFLYAILEVSSSGGLLLLKKVRNLDYPPVHIFSLSQNHRRIIGDLIEQRSHYVGHSPSLGWTIKPNGVSELYRANSQGLRADRDYRLLPRAEVVRIAAFGDSFTHCDDVSNKDTWEEKLSNLAPALEVMNFGVGGYGLDQAYLRYRQDGEQFKPHIVLVGFMPGDILRTVSVFRPFDVPETGLPLAKPRFVIVHDRLVLLKNPMQRLSDYQGLLANPDWVLPRLGHADYYYQLHYEASWLDILPSIRLAKLVGYTMKRRFDRNRIFNNGHYNESADAYQVTTRIFDLFVDDALRNNSLPIVVIFPNLSDLLQYQEHKTKSYAPLLSYLTEKGYPTIDLVDAFEVVLRGVPATELVAGHYSPLANELVAQYIYDVLRTRGLTHTAGIELELHELRGSRVRAEQAVEPPGTTDSCLATKPTALWGPLELL